MTIRELRQHRDMSLSELERTTGIHRGTLSKIERGLEAPSPEQLAAISEALDMPVNLWSTRLILVCPDTLVAI